MTRKITLIRDYNLNGKTKKAGTELECTKDFIQELADGGYIETDARYKAKKKPKRSKIVIENTNLNKK